MFFIFFKKIFLYLLIFSIGGLVGALFYKKAQTNEAYFLTKKRIDIVSNQIKNQIGFQTSTNEPSFNLYHEMLHHWFIGINEVDKHFFTK
ncbi:MAG: hypothetical protein U9532_01185 ['Conium maculatum' witches'-broom phytoplasma]|nr:hypothetical protein ['Conium maculatum' witches'-broom phytoplasma]